MPSASERAIARRRQHACVIDSLLDPAVSDARSRAARGGLRKAAPAGRVAPSPLARIVGQRRAHILEALRTAKTTGEVATAAGIAVSTASEHLHELVLAQVVDRFRSGRFVYYVLNDSGRWLVDELAAPRSDR